MSLLDRLDISITLVIILSGNWLLLLDEKPGGNPSQERADKLHAKQLLSSKIAPIFCDFDR